MPYIAPEVVTEAKRMDLLTYLRTYEPGQLVRVSGNTYCTREHDSLSFATLARIEGEDWRKLNLVSLSGVYLPKQEMEKSKVPVTLQKLLEKNPQISRIVLHFDNDIAGRKAAKTLEILLKDRYEVVDEPPQRGKDFNDFLCIQLGILKQNERSFER